VLHHFVTGPYLWDSGWYASAIFQNGFLLPNPPFLQHLLGASLFTQHLYLLVSLASPASYLFGTHYHYFATVIGATYALTFAGPFLCVMSIRREADRSVWLALLATAAGFAFTFSGAVISGLGYPHFEAGIAACFLMFLGLHFLNLRRASWVALAIGLAIREDAGLHYAGYLMLIALYQWRSGAWPMPRRTVMGALAISVAASVAMLAVQRYYFPLGASMFDKSFVGTPPFAHVNAAELSRRVSAFLTGSPAIYVPAIVVAVAALVARAPILLLGYAACVPWVVLNVVFSLTPAAETLSLYYGFPLLVGLAWPIVATHWMRTQPASRAKRYAMPAFFAAAIGSALVLPHHRQVDASAIAGGKLSAAAYTRERECLEAEFRFNPKLYADTYVVAMFPASVPPARVLASAAEIAAVDAEGLVFYEGDRAAPYQDRAWTLHLWYPTEVSVPPIRLLTRTPSRMAACLQAGTPASKRE
jgi:hypothetical protein